MPSSDLELLRSFRNNTEWFDNNYENLKKYNGHYIAIHRESIVDSDSNYRSLVERNQNLYDKSVFLTLVTMHGTLSPAK
jgi:Family of unknown function (DUF5678)